MKNAEMENKVLCGTALSSSITSARVRDHTSKQFTNAVLPVHENKKNLPEYNIEYYKIQSLQTLGESNEQVSVPIFGSIVANQVQICKVGLSTSKKPSTTSILLHQD